MTVSLKSNMHPALWLPFCHAVVLFLLNGEWLQGWMLTVPHAGKGWQALRWDESMTNWSVSVTFLQIQVKLVNAPHIKIHLVKIFSGIVPQNRHYIIGSPLCYFSFGSYNEILNTFYIYYSMLSLDRPTGPVCSTVCQFLRVTWPGAVVKINLISPTSNLSQLMCRKKYHIFLWCCPSLKPKLFG